MMILILIMIVIIIMLILIMLMIILMIQLRREDEHLHRNIMAVGLPMISISCTTSQVSSHFTFQTGLGKLLLDTGHLESVTIAAS